MDLTADMKRLLFDLLRQPISIEELTGGAGSIEQKTELYLVSCLAIDPDQPAEQAHLEQLAQALQLPGDLARQLQWQAQQALIEAA